MSASRKFLAIFSWMSLDSTIEYKDYTYCLFKLSYFVFWHLTACCN